jgi:hypothetical protein
MSDASYDRFCDVLPENLRGEANTRFKLNEVRTAEGSRMTPLPPDLSGAYGDSEDTLSWPQLVRVVLYSVTVGWLLALGRFAWLCATSTISSSFSEKRAPVSTERKIRHMRQYAPR